MPPLLRFFAARLWAVAAVLAFALALGGCRGPSQETPIPAVAARVAALPADLAPAGVFGPGQGSARQQASENAPVRGPILAGRVDFGSAFRTQGSLGAALDAATVTLADSAGNVLASGLTDHNGAFSLTVPFSPVGGGAYLLEASRGLADSLPGSPVARLRTIVSWNGSNWLSITNASSTGAVLINSLTTAIAIVSALDPVNIPPGATIGKVNAVGNPASLNSTPVLTGHTDAEIASLAADLVKFLGADLDPVRSASGLQPAISRLSTSSAGVGTMVVIEGTGFNPLSGQTAVSFAGTPGQIYLATSTRLFVTVPAGASAGDVTVETAAGSSGPAVFTVARRNIAVQPGAFAGRWRIVGVQDSWQTGSKAATLAFAPRAVSINMNGFPGTWLIGGVTGWLEGTRTVQMLPGKYSMTVAYGAGSFQFVVSRNGFVSVDSNGCATGGASSLTLDTISIAVTAQSEWLISGVIGWVGSGNYTVSLVKNIPNYSITGYSYGSNGWRSFATTATGTTPNSFNFGGRTITFNR